MKRSSGRWGNSGSNDVGGGVDGHPTVPDLAFGARVVGVAPHQGRPAGGVSLTAWFAVLVVFVLAEVFREGARLRREAELTI